MSMIEGIGDEIVHLFGVVVLGVLGFVAWWSTGIRERPQIRTVLILEHRTTDTNSSTPTVTPPTAECSKADSSQSSPRGENPNTEEDSEEKEEGEPTLRQRVVGETNATSSSSSETPPEPTETEDNIRIRLKYLNDDQKLVEGRRQELLGDFKRRHFSVELSADKLVRLIFNGQVLHRDNLTLQGCGLYDNCVVHCIIHQKRTPMGNGRGTGQQTSSSSPPPEWNLGTILCSSLMLILILAWYFRFQNPQFFSITSTASLVCLTAIFMLCILSMYMAEGEAVPTN